MGKGNIGPLPSEAPLENSEALLAKFRKLGFRHVNDYTVTPILYIILPKFETPLVENLGGQLPGASPPSFIWGDGFMGTQTHLPPKFSFSSDFGHFILKMLENAKL